ncbi:MAG: prepilin-type N-terminal cleavage/methylation domain-containing protein, partial [Acidimicrobiia bacterium]|nr:prepilin-type N-terminal cleavage/methylation domain-containing protein [Acidimicrobiia bacterium]
MRKRRDDGFTLPEVLLSIVILGIIMSALSVAMITALRTRDEPAKKLGPSNDANLVSIYFGPDVQSAGQVSTDPAGSFDCATTPAGTKVVSLGWRTADGVDIVTGYFADASVLTRVQCVKGGALTGTNVVADNLGGCTPLPTCAAAAEIETSSGSSAVILTLLTLDAEAEPGDPAFPFSLRAVGRRISNDEGTPGGGGGSNNTLPPGEIRGTLTQHSDYAGSGAGTPLAAVPVYLRRNGVLLASSKTDASGRYFFGTLRDDATYQLEVVEDDLPPHVAPTDGQSLLTTVAVPAASPGPAIVDRNLKVWEPVGSVTGLVTVSIGGGPAVPVVNAVVNNVTTDDTATTDATGRYTFSFLNPGTYQ